ncbi:SusC/RagA family TonB-linked outer membrane protein [Pedobacter aquatilis]|uniref:SusC/RagA family TonB-linked outer membrane protein n=1 Tax=Pedobacter aquatilis TaxID=351343 RepID=UPI002930A936|nr:SusC/RagA family TonB-linked outer membrane protein [Pedobacter aquatilis]
MTRIFTKPIYYLLMVFFSVGISFNASAQERKISVEEALNTISKKYKTKFAYEHTIIQGKSTSSESLKAKSLDEALKNVLYNNNLLFLYVSEGNYTIVSRDEKLFDNNKNNPKSQVTDAIERDIFISGLVVDETGNPLPGATIKSDASNKAMTTDGNGRFSLFVPVTATNIGFSYLGYQNSSVAIAKFKGNTVINMIPSLANQLEEVDIVSNGYQVLPKERATGAAVEVKAADLKKIPTPNVISRLESLVPGMKVNLYSDNMFTYGNTQVAINGGTRTKGQSDYTMAIRGTSTLLGETFPLVVIDGAVSEMDLATINPNDIASISFLKDAAAASIWGTRAANGVIVITTKRGAPNQAPKISFSVNAAMSNRPDLSYLKLMTSAQTIAYEQDLVAKNLITTPNANTPFGQPVASITDLTFQLRAGTITQAQYDAAIANYSAIDNRSQISEYLLRPSNNQQYDFSISGGGKSSDYFYSASYGKENPYAIGTSGQRLTVTMNNTFKLFKVATLSTNLKGSFFKYKTNGQSLNTLFSPAASTLMPYNLLVDGQGNRIQYARQYYGPWTDKLQSQGFLNWRYNPLDEMDNSDNSQNDNNYAFNLNLNVPIVKGLSAIGFFSNERSFGNTRSYYNEQTYYYRNLLNGFTPIPTTGTAVNSLGLNPGSGVLSNINTTQNNYTVRGQLNYDGTFGNNHQLTAIAGSEIRQTKVGQGSSRLYGYNDGTGISRPVNYLAPYNSIFGSGQNLSGSPEQQDKTRRYLSYYSNAAYTYRGKYTVSGSVRYDDYNNFGVDRKFRATPLWSAGVKWDASKESFLNKFQWLSNLSVRGTYGVNGNISTTLYPFTYIGLGSGDLTTGLPNASIISPANSELRWEKTYVANLGVDFGFFNSRISGAVDIYNKRGKDLFYEFPVNGTYGVTTLIRNSTSLSGNGVDLSLRGAIIRKGDVELTSGINFSYNNNKVTDTRFALNSSFFSNPAYGVNLNGYATDKMMVYRNAGLDATGLTQVYDELGNKVPSSRNITSLDALVYAGRKNAPYFGSFNTSFRYKKLTLMAIATYQFGNVFLKPTISAYPTARTGLRYDLHEDIARRWTKAGDEAFTNVPGAVGTFAALSLLRYQQSDINVLKGDYIRLRELSLSYQLPVERLTNFVKGANFGFSVRNLGLLWTANKEHIDPDFTAGLTATTLGLPSTVSYNFSLNVNF